MFDYLHKTHPRARSIKLKIETDGQLVVVTPKGMPKFLIDRFINQQQNWIIKHQTKINLRYATKLPANAVQLFGKQYQMQVINDHKQATGIIINDSTLIINSINELSETKIKSKLELFFKGTAEKYIFPRTHQLGKLMKIDFKTISLRQQKSRWGSCSSRGTLSFNWRLVHFEPAVIDYVIIHELAHRVHMNHSSAFWQLVQIYDSKHKQHRQVLKRYQNAFT